MNVLTRKYEPTQVEPPVTLPARSTTRVLVGVGVTVNVEVRTAVGVVSGTLAPTSDIEASHEE
jgi:hypothetical protein